MDDSRFDLLTRRLASGVSRRGILKGVLSAAVAVGMGAIRGSGAVGASCRNVGQSCREHANCCSNVCGPEDQSGRKVCACPPGQEACDRTCVDPASAYLEDVKNCGACGYRCPAQQCNAAICTAGVCGLIPKPALVETECDDGNPCTLNDVCRDDGSCAGLPRDCTHLDDECNTGVCDPASGECFPQPVSNGTTCADGDPCTIGDECRDGVCESGPHICPDRGPCFINAACNRVNPSSDTCTYDNAPSTTTCDEGDENCVDGLCCPSERVCTTGAGDVCCSGGQKCNTLSIGDSSFGVCCDTGVDACYGFDLNGGSNLGFDAVCCGTGERCLPLDLSTTPVSGIVPEGVVGVCCPNGSHACTDVAVVESSIEVRGFCCTADQPCQTIFPDPNFGYSTCCAVDPCMVGSALNDPESFDAVCCSSDTVCVSAIDLPELTVGQCCPPGDSVIINLTTTELRCCGEPCLVYREGSTALETVCCADTHQVCAAVSEVPVTIPGFPPLPKEFGRCCAPGKSACLTPDSFGSDTPSVVCCDNCQSVPVTDPPLSVCCPANQVPEVEVDGDGFRIMCVDPD